MAYARNPQWKDHPDTSTPITAAALDNIEDGLRLAAAVADAAYAGRTQVVTLTGPNQSWALGAGNILGVWFVQDAVGGNSPAWADIWWRTEEPAIDPAPFAETLVSFVRGPSGRIYGYATGGAVSSYPANSDYTAPSVPTSLNAIPTSSAITLTWAASTDNDAVAHYEVTRDGGTTIYYVLAGPSYDRTWTWSGLTASTEYTVQVRAVDPSGNKSAWASATVSTLASGGGALAGDDFTGDGVDFTVHTQTTLGTPTNWLYSASPSTSGANWKLFGDACASNFAAANGGAAVFNYSSADVTLEASMIRDSTGGAGAKPGVVLRYADDNNLIRVWQEDGYVGAHYKLAGTTTVIAGIDGTNLGLSSNAYHTWKVIVNGTSISVQVDGGTVLNGTLPSGLTGTKYGMCNMGTAAQDSKIKWDYVRITA